MSAEQEHNELIVGLVHAKQPEVTLESEFDGLESRYSPIVLSPNGSANGPRPAESSERGWVSYEVDGAALIGSEAAG